MTSILAIDPGPENTAFLLWEICSVDAGEGRVVDKGFVSNKDLLHRLRMGFLDGKVVAIEMIASYGMPVGKEVFETCVFIGRLVEIIGDQYAVMVYRKDIKLYLCGSPRAKDANIRQALIDRVGPQGKKANPGPTYGLAKHDWAALAIALYVADSIERKA